MKPNFATEHSRAYHCGATPAYGGITVAFSWPVLQYAGMMRSLVPLSVPGLLLLSLLSSEQAYAVCMDIPGRYDAETRRLDEALQDFAHNSGCFVHVLPDQERTQSAHWIHGRYRPADALAALLEGTSLRAVRTSEGFRLESVTPTGTSSDQDARKPAQTDGSKAQPTSHLVR
ncbi:hypothetical protein APT_10086 (plasmid) [Acetobacter pasteurianus NBRC 101655]|uniref:Secretin/TonB short N-terminal domain-containing protein n=2 Tax=Acetobacter TaxID=434 RepID=A0A2G4RFT0_9PROT|nr:MULTISPECIES: hypothetical protein [Acetobacter]PHY95433.1 hypothetical protein CSR02_00995 [Acetobacter pomorum]BAU39830.1 hypothetical protein APT_10086 [Acetobacter pasteurianus NBRC 101655]CCT60893.1 hypothetical protein APA386B_1P115 [Acetobacter pasteurianus 386B]